jgi:hypothetical protein
MPDVAEHGGENRKHGRHRTSIRHAHALWQQRGTAWQPLSVLKECDAAGRIGLESAAVVKRGPEGNLSIPESADNVGLVGTASGSLIGMLVGVLGGPVGVLLGWGTGALMGGAFDVCLCGFAAGRPSSGKVGATVSQGKQAPQLWSRQGGGNGCRQLR